MPDLDETTETTEPTETNTERNWRQLEQARDKFKAQAEKWRKIAIEGVVDRAGYDLNSKLTSLVLEKYLTDATDPDVVSPESFTEFAETWDLHPKSTESTQSTEGGDETETQQAHENERTLEQLQAQSNRVASIVQPATTPDLVAQAEEALSKGDVSGSIGLKIRAMSGELG